MAIHILKAALVFGSNHSDRDGAPKGIVLHHAAAGGRVEDIHKYHKNTNGWAGIGYHFYVRKDGTIWRGRPENWLGAHTTGHNNKLGICAEGNFDNDTMSAAQQAAIIDLIAYLQETYGTLPIYRHSDLDATSCPGKYYPFDTIVGGGAEIPPKDTRVRDFQTAAIADGLPLNVYGADGIWGGETAAAAASPVQNGRVGNRVKLIQELVGADADGIFGSKTEAAVRAFQKAHGLVVDGIVGIRTWKALLGVTA